MILNTHSKKNIFLHIGMPKTGTSAIQEFLFFNRSIIQSFGFEYPIIDDHLNSKHWFPQTNIRSIFLNGLSTLEDYQNYYLNNFFHKIEKSNFDNIILSDEIIFLYGINFIKVLEKFYDNLKIIVYIRKPSEYIASLWGEMVKPYMNCNPGNLYTYFNKTNINYEQIITLINHIGRDNVIIRPYEFEQFYNNNLISDFLKILGCDIKFDYNNIKANSSFSRNDSEILRLISHLCIPHQEKGNIIPYLSNIKDNVSIIDSIDDNTIEFITNKYRPILKKIFNLCGYNNFFISDYPKNYLKAKDIFKSIKIDVMLYDMICNFIKTNNINYNNQIEGLNNQIEGLNNQVAESNNLITQYDTLIKSLTYRIAQFENMNGSTHLKLALRKLINKITSARIRR